MGDGLYAEQDTKDLTCITLVYNSDNNYNIISSIYKVK